MKMVERVQKVLAQLGVASRRAVESLISEGRVKINGKVAQLGDKVSPSCQMMVDGKPVTRAQVESKVMLYHKPVGEVCSHQPEPHQISVFDKLPPSPTGRWLSVGRLDINTSGLLIITNDGQLIQRMQHPKFGHQRTYRVRAYGQFNPTVWNKLQSEMVLEDGPAKFDKITHDSSQGPNHWFTVSLGEGRHRLVRRMFSALGLEVNRLIRTQFGNTVLPRQLRPGQYQWLNL